MTLSNPRIQVGDLVKMKYIWFRRKRPVQLDVPYAEVPLLVMEVHANAIKVMLPNGTLKSDLAEYYEAVGA